MMIRRDQIKCVAAKLFVEKGVAGTSVRDIADGVGMSSGSLYHHFPSKDAIAFAILDEFITELCSRYAAVLPHVSGTREEIRALLRSSVEVAAAHPYATEIYQNELTYHGPEAPARIAEGARIANEFWLATAMRGHNSGDLRPEIDPTEIARMLRESVWWSVRHHRTKLTECGGEIVDRLVTVFLDGAASPGPARRDSRHGTAAASQGRAAASEVAQRAGANGRQDPSPAGIEARLAALEERLAALEGADRP